MYARGGSALAAVMPASAVLNTNLVAAPAAPVAAAPAAALVDGAAVVPVVAVAVPARILALSARI